MLVRRSNLNVNRVGMGDWDYDPMTGEWVELPTAGPDGPVYTVTTTAMPPPDSPGTTPTANPIASPMLDPRTNDGLPGKPACDPNVLYPTGHRCNNLQIYKDAQATIRVVQTAAGVKQPAAGASPGVGVSLDSITNSLNSAASTAAGWVSRNAPAAIVTVALLMLVTSMGGGPGGEPATGTRRRGRG